MHRVRKKLAIPAKLREKLECPGLALESAFVDDGSPETLVMVHRIDPLPQTRGTTQSVVKFSSTEFAIPNARRLRLGTHRYYREYDGPGADIQDDMEAKFREDISDTRFRSMRHLGQQSSFSAQVTMRGKDKWIFCTSIVSPWSVESTTSHLGKRFGYQCGTRVLNPPAFAQELGAVFAANTSRDEVRLDGFNKVLQLLVSKNELKRIIFVHHGPVYYPIDAAEAVRSFPKHLQSAIVPFLKRPEFGWQQEYRFAISFLGEPRTKTLLLPIPTKLRSLTSVIWQESVRVFR